MTADELMTAAQAATLKELAEAAYELDAFKPNLTRTEADNLAEQAPRSVMLFRGWMLKDLKRAGALVGARVLLREFGPSCCQYSIIELSALRSVKKASQPRTTRRTFARRQRVCCRGSSAGRCRASAEFG